MKNVGLPQSFFVENIVYSCVHIQMLK